LFAQTTPRETLLSDRQSWEARLPLPAEGDAHAAVERLMELQHSGVRIRPRALITTLWARLALGDLFIHGIGGAKYDCVTDRLIQRFFGLAAPHFLVVSATLHLPIKHDRTTPDDLRSVQHEQRDLTYHPERYLTNSPDTEPPTDSVPLLRRSSAGDNPLPNDHAELIAEKHRWIATPQTANNASRRCQAIRRINAALQPWLDNRRKQLAERQAEISRRLQAEAILSWREYPFCLYPESTLREFLSGLFPKTT
jgi:hypothetical protein